MQDGLGRKIEYLRISVTDRCNLRCRYCMPKDGIEQFAHEDCLTLEEIHRIVTVMADMGLKKVRFTGGEPMVRKNLVKLVRDTAGLPQIKEVAMTTNGVLFADRVAEFAQAGLTSVNISLDTTDAATYKRITGRDEFQKVFSAIEQSIAAGLKVKINCVPARELNGNPVDARGSYLRVAELAGQYPVDVRFIELMPIGCGKSFTRITGDETLQALQERYGEALDEAACQEGEAAWRSAGVRKEMDDPVGPARYVRFPGFVGRIGFIDPMSHRFCDRCNRVRLTVDGKLKLCLYYADGMDIKKLLRDGISNEQLQAAIREGLQKKPREHHFLEEGETDVLGQTPEMRRMVQIGG